tara:strand:+ start:119 stop:451 length:333 start_codon:yes stop_codon:yes gene_type:complete
MAGITKVNQDGRDHGVQYNPGQIIGIEIDAGASLAAKDGIDGALASIVREFQPLMYKSTSTNGKIFAIVDGHSVDATSMTARLQALGTVDGINLSSQTVVVRDLDAFDAS